MKDDFTLILNTVSQGNAESADALLPLVYEELRRLAHAQMASESAHHTLQPTALVHEAWLRMVRDEGRNWRNRAYFFSAAATAMRRILVEHARSKGRLKRGGNRHRVDRDMIDLATPAMDDSILWVDEALQQLEQVHPQRARVVILKYFAGMTHEETAEALSLSQATVERYWAFSKAWLYDRIVTWVES